MHDFASASLTQCIALFDRTLKVGVGEAILHLRKPQPDVITCHHKHSLPTRHALSRSMWVACYSLDEFPVKKLPL